MKLPKAVCVIGAPLTTLTEGGILAGIGYGLFASIGKFIEIIAPFISWISQDILVAALYIWYSLPTIPHPWIVVLEYIGAATIGVISLIMIVMIFYLWSKYNFERCQSFWTTHVNEAKPVPILGVVKKKPPNWMCVMGSPLVIVLELSIIGLFFGAVYLAIASIPPTTTPVYLTQDQAIQAITKAAADKARADQIIKYIALGMMSIVSMFIFVIWSKWNYTLCRRYWSKGDTVNA